MKYGYIRVSTDKQDYARQECILKDYQIDKIFEEKLSGTKKATTRPEFEKMINEIQAGDSIYFESMSRMARSMQDLIDTTNYLAKQKKVRIVFLKENITVDGNGNGLDAMTNLIFNIMGAFAQFERDLLSDRTKQGLQARKEMGVVLGKPKTYKEETINKVKDLRAAGLTLQEIADTLNMSVATAHRIIKEA